MKAPDKPLDLLDGDFYAGDPNPTYAWMRAEAPVYRDDGNELWGVTRHADIHAVERDPERFHSSRGFRPGLPSDLSMIGMDDPKHADQRKVVFRRFTPRAVRNHEARVREVVTERIDLFARQGKCELVRDLAAPLPAITIVEMLGFDVERWEEIQEWSDITNSAGGGPRYFHDGVMEAMREYAGYTLDVVRKRRANPRDDLISAIAHTPIHGAERSDEEIMLEALLILNGGSETTRHVIAGAALALLQHPEQRALLIDDPRRLPVAVEEFIRWVTPILNMVRRATRDSELRGVTIREGEQVLLMYSAANRDEEVFDAPERFDVTRRPNPHVAFGLGTHFCLGASLARLELRVAFEELLRRLPDFDLPSDARLEFTPNAFTRGLRALPLEFSPER